jgi:hypothetical protein
MAVIILTGIIIMAGCSPKQEKDTSINGKVIFKAGEVTINDKPASNGSILKAGDILKTSGGDSLCEFQVGDKNIFRLKGEGELVYNFKEDTPHLRINSGWLAGVARYKKLLKGDFEINTPTLTASVRGTSFCMKVEDPKSVYFCTCNGTIELEDSKGNNRHVDTFAHHGARRYKTAPDGSIQSAKADMLYHGDDAIDSLAEKIGVTVDWTKPHGENSP